MSENSVIEVNSRSETGKNVSRRLRKTGLIPGVIYGLDRPAFKLSVSPKKVDEILRLESGRNTILTLSLVGQDESRAVMIKELQRDPVTGDVVHVDFIRLDLEQKVTVKVPIHLTGTATGVKNEAGIMDFIHRTVEVECLPVDIPENLELDVTELHVNQHVSVSDIRLDDKIRILEDPAMVLAVVVPPKAEAVAVEEEAEVEETVEEEPQVIKKGKEAAPEEEGASKKKEGE